MVKVISIVKNSIGDTVGYDILDLNTNQTHQCVKIENLVGIELSNAIFVGGKTPYIKGKKALDIREIHSIVTLYHGSNYKVDTPKFGLGKQNNDYGQGFYTTTIADKADEWALMMPGDSIRNQYEIDLSGLTILNLDNYGPLAWIAEVLHNRGSGDTEIDEWIKASFIKKYRVGNQGYDIVTGYRADDSYFSIIESFLNNEISVSEVIQLFYKAKLGKQVFIQSRKAFSRIKFIKASKVSNSKLGYAKNNDANARLTAQQYLRDRRQAIITGRINMEGQLTFKMAFIKNLIYNRQDGKYYEA